VSDLPRPPLELGGEDAVSAIERLEQTPSFGAGLATAVGAAMLGLEEALRSQPPPEVMAAQHRPIRGLSGQDQEIVLVFPDDPPAEAGADR
jgi:hypothetical protein